MPATIGNVYKRKVFPIANVLWTTVIPEWEDYDTSTNYLRRSDTGGIATATDANLARDFILVSTP